MFLGLLKKESYMRKKNYYYRHFTISLILLAVFSSFTYIAYADPDGRTGRTSSTSNGCGSCHGSSSSSQVSVSVESASGSFTVSPGSVTTFTVTVSTTNSGLKIAGLNMGVKTDQTTSPGTNAGSLSAGSGLKLSGNPQEITQSSPKNLSGGAASWTVQWTAPSTPGTYYMRVLGFCGDDDGNDDSDDRWNWMPVQALTVESAGSISLIEPDGGDEICAGSVQPIRWTSSGVSLARIELSSDGGGSWPTLLVNNHDAASGLWNWSVPVGQSPGDQYRVRVLDASNQSLNDFSAANFSIYSKTTVTSQPVSKSVCKGETASFSVTAIGRNLEYQWRKDGVNILNAKSRTLDILNVSKDDEGEYKCSVKGLCDTALSNAASLVILESPVITSEPQGDTVCAGSSFTFAITATGDELHYLWNRDGVSLSNSDSPLLEINNITVADSGKYKCFVSGTCFPSDTSIAAHLVVFSPVEITKSPVDKDVIQGSDITFSVTASGTNISYQWRKDGVDIPDSTSSTLSIINVTKADSGNYTCAIENRCGQKITDNAKLSVSDEAKPIIELSFVSLEFGGVSTGEAKDTLLTDFIYNKSNLPLTINSISLSGVDAVDFTISDIQLPVTIPANEYADLSLTFEPNSLGAKSARVDFTTDASNDVTLSLSGTGADFETSLTVNDWDFGEVVEGESKKSHNKIVNEGTTVETIEMPVLIAGDIDSFTLSEPGKFPVTLAPLDSVIVEFVFNPTAAGIYEATVNVPNTSLFDLNFKLFGSAIISGVHDSYDEIFKIQPNPASDFVEILMPESNIISNVKVLDILGNEIVSFNNLTSPVRWNLNSSEGRKCPSGIYFIIINSGNRMTARKLLID